MYQRVLSRREQSHFGQHLFNLRTNANLTRRKLAQMAEVSEHTLQSLEQGRTSNPTFDTLRGLADALQVPFTELVEPLFTEPRAKQPSAPKSNFLESIFSEEQLEALRALRKGGIRMPV